MRLAPSFATLLAVLSFSSSILTLASAANQPNGDVIRVPLERKWDITHPPPGPSPNGASAELVARTNDGAGPAITEFLKSHVIRVGQKYQATLAAYEANTGTVHPLADAISAITTGIFGGQTASGPVPAGKMEKRRRMSDDGRSKRDVSLVEVNGNMWMGTISVGSPPKTFMVDFDTGSSDLILPNQTCGSTCDGHTKYDPTQSSTSVDIGNTFQLAYGGGSNVDGTQYADNVFVDGNEAVNQTFGAATTYSSGLQISDFPPDGLLGMGFPTISALGASPVFQTMVSSGAVKEGVFGFALSSQSGGSELTIGGTNTNMYQESTIEYISVSLPAYWQIPLAGLTRPGLNGTSEVVVANKTSYAQSIIDTGTTLIMTSDSNAQAFYANVPGAQPSSQVGGGVWTVPCDIIGSITPTLTFGSRNFTVSPFTFNLGPVSNGSTDCIAGLAGGGSAYWIIGDVFLQNVYTVFDVDNARVGFANLA